MFKTVLRKAFFILQLLARKYNSLDICWHPVLFGQQHKELFYNCILKNRSAVKTYKSEKWTDTALDNWVWKIKIIDGSGQNILKFLSCPVVLSHNPLVQQYCFFRRQVCERLQQDKQSQKWYDPKIYKVSFGTLTGEFSQRSIQARTCLKSASYGTVELDKIEVKTFLWLSQLTMIEKVRWNALQTENVQKCITAKQQTAGYVSSIKKQLNRVFPYRAMYNPVLQASYLISAGECSYRNLLG